MEKENFPKIEKVSERYVGMQSQIETFRENIFLLVGKKDYNI